MTRNLLMDLHEHVASVKFLLRDRDTKFTAAFTVAFDAVFGDAGIRILRTPIQAPELLTRRVAVTVSVRNFGGLLAYFLAEPEIIRETPIRVCGQRERRHPRFLGPRSSLSGFRTSSIISPCQEFWAPRANAIMQRWIGGCRRELLDRTLVWNQRHLLHILRNYEAHHNTHRPHRCLGQAAPLKPLPAAVTDLDTIRVRRRDRVSGAISEYTLAA